MRAKTNFEVLFNAKTEHLYRELESAKRNYEFAVKEFITSHLIPDREFEEAYENNPEPKPQFRNMYKRLNDFFTNEEWNLLEELNNDINPHPHHALPILCNGNKEVILPINYSPFASLFQNIAKKSNVVSDPSSLIVKNQIMMDSIRCL